eukprot:307703-Lingulodinium_polyedra.AAC.1
MAPQWKATERERIPQKQKRQFRTPAVLNKIASNDFGGHFRAIKCDEIAKPAFIGMFGPEHCKKS